MQQEAIPYILNGDNIAARPVLNPVSMRRPSMLKDTAQRSQLNELSPCPYSVPRAHPEVIAAETGSGKSLACPYELHLGARVLEGLPG